MVGAIAYVAAGVLPLDVVELALASPVAVRLALLVSSKQALYFCTSAAGAFGG
jgi:hypothetical protein